MPRRKRKEKAPRIVWKPQPKQAEFMSRPEYECLYGGAAGGGKSDAMVAEALRQVEHPLYKAILFRKTYPQCEDLIAKSLRIYPLAYPGAKYNASKHFWRFPSGATIYFGSMPNATSHLDYQGRSFCFIGFDELTHFTQKEYEYLISRNRADGAGLRTYVRATANPGGLGHAWVKERFITASEPGVPYTAKTEVMHDGKIITVERTRVFIPSTVFDNAALMENDPGYVSSLALLPEAQRKALLYGDWDSFEGQVFSEFRNDPTGYISKINTHVIDPFDIPRTWKRYRSFDYGYSKPFAVQWWAVDYDGRAYLYRQFYGCQKDSPNVGLKLEPHTLARKIREIEDELERGNEIIGVADPAIWDESRGRDGTIITMFEREGIYFEKGRNDRFSGKMQCHYRFAFDEDGRPMAYIFNTCKPFLRTVPNLVYDQNNVEDVDTTMEDHDYDAMRYFFMLNPIAPNRIIEKKYRGFDPLSND